MALGVGTGITAALWLAPDAYVDFAYERQTFMRRGCPGNVVMKWTWYEKKGDWLPGPNVLGEHFEQY